MQKIKKIPKKYLIISGIFILVISIWYFFLRTPATETTYVYSKVKSGEISVEVTGTGQISASNEIALTSKVSGKIISIPVAVGSQVGVGTLLAQIDARDAYVDLENARISYQKLIQSADSLTVLQTENAFKAAKENVVSAEAALYVAYDSGFSTLASAFIDIPTVLGGLKDVFNQRGYISESNSRIAGGSSFDHRTQASNAYYSAKDSYDADFRLFQNISRQSSTTSIEKMISDTYKLAQLVSQALKDTKNTADYIENKLDGNDAEYIAVRSDLDSWTSTNNSHINALASAITKIQDAKTSLDSARRTAEEKKEALFDLENGPDELDLRSQTLALQQKENAYADAFIRAPFDGILAKLNVKLGDEVSNGTNIGTFITKQKIATISLNEIDAAKIKVGQKVSLTVDAIDGLTIEGTVSEIDLVGTVSQGVVTYGVKIALNTQDERVRSGMSISATVVTESKSNILVVPNAAIKNGSVQMKDLSFKKIQTGISNDYLTEVVSGLKEGDDIVTKTVQGTKTTTPAAPSLFSNVRPGATRTR